MPDLCRDIKVDGRVAGVSITGPCTVMVDGTTVWGGASARIDIASSSDAGKMVPSGGQFNHSDGSFKCDAVGTYFLSVFVQGATSTTNISIEYVQ